MTRVVSIIIGNLIASALKLVRDPSTALDSLVLQTSTLTSMLIPQKWGGVRNLHPFLLIHSQLHYLYANATSVVREVLTRTKSSARQESNLVHALIWRSTVYKTARSP